MTMKKIVLLFVLMMVSSSAFAQLVTTTRVYRERNHNHHLAIDMGIGGYTGDVYDMGLGLDFGLRYNYTINQNIGIDIIKASVQTGTNHFGEALQLQAKTGVRGVSPVLFGQSSLYGNFGIGASYLPDPQEVGVAWEIGAGLNITPRFAVGAAYNSTHVDGVSFGLISFRLSVNLF